MSASFKSTVQKAIADTKYADTLRDLVRRATADDVSALAELNETFSFTAADLKLLNVKQPFNPGVDKCYAGTQVTLVALLGFVCCLDGGTQPALRKRPRRRRG